MSTLVFLTEEEGRALGPKKWGGSRPDGVFIWPVTVFKNTAKDSAEVFAALLEEKLQANIAKRLQ